MIIIIEQTPMSEFSRPRVLMLTPWAPYPYE